jgi:hypothetical protein
MDKPSLQALFGASLDYGYDGKAYSFLSSPPKSNDAGEQLPTIWKIEFIINPQGIVTDYTLTKTDEK